MKLLTKGIIDKLEKRGRVDEYKDNDPIIAKFFNPTGAGTKSKITMTGFSMG